MFEELIRDHLWFLYLCLGILALVIGSFLNVVIYRLPLMLQNQWQTEAQALLGLQTENKMHYNLMVPRSSCPKCSSKIPAWHNIPILSYLILRARCHHCQTKIPTRYPLIEFLTLILSFIPVLLFGFTLHTLFALIAIWICICLVAIDLEHHLLPDNLTLLLLWTGLLANTWELFTPLSDAVLGAIAAYLSLWIFIQIYYWKSGKIGMGNGDFKLFAAFGAWCGWKILPLILFFASVSGALAGIVFLSITHKDKDTPIPFGPFLCFSGIIVLFWGQAFMRWYLNLWL